MAELEREVRTFQVDMLCDQCGKGKMLPTGIALMVHPPKYPHECTECDNRETYDETYPTRRFKWAEEKPS